MTGVSVSSSMAVAIVTHGELTFSPFRRIKAGRGPARLGARLADDDGWRWASARRRDAQVTVRRFAVYPVAYDQLEGRMKSVRTAVVMGACLIVLCTFTPMAGAEDIGVEVQEVKVVLVEQSLVVLLIVGNRFVPIHVDATVAGSIYSVLSGTPTPPPLSHPLIPSILLHLVPHVPRLAFTLTATTSSTAASMTRSYRHRTFNRRCTDV